MNPFWDKLVEVYKARLTLAAALFGGLIALTGYGIANKNVTILLLCVAVPPLILALDYFVKTRYCAPLMYKAFVRDLSEVDEEPLAVVFLALGKGHMTELRAIHELPAGAERQVAFQRYYSGRYWGLRVALAAVGSAGELLLALAALTR